MLIVFDVGNTETVIGLYRDAELADHWRVATQPERTTDEFGLLVRSLIRESGFDPDDIRGAAVGSVVPPVTAVIAELCERHLGPAPVILDARADLPVRIDIDEPRTVGADRIANTIAASTLFRRDTIVVDFGTATTYDCITGDGAFVGGVISPGVQTGAETLVRRTAKLPRVDLVRPPRVVGRSTEQALRSGIFFAAVDATDGMVRRITAEWKRADPLVVATGGIAPLIASHCSTVHRIEPFLTLDGLRLAFDHLGRRQGTRGGGRGGWAG